LQPPEDEVGLSSYLETVRERLHVVLAAVAITISAAVLYLVLATKTYEAHADLLVTPFSSSDEVFGLPLIRESVDPTRAVDTAARLVDNIDVAERVRDELGLAEGAQEVLDRVQVDGVATSNVIAVPTRADSPEEARNLANSFALTAVELKTERLHTQLQELIPRIQTEVRRAGLTAGDTELPALQATLAELKTLQANPGDPNLGVQTKARLPTSAVSPRPFLTLAVSTVAGLILGIVAAFAAQGIDPRLRREEQLRRRYSLPILGRIPLEEATRLGNPLKPAELSAPAREAYRTLRGTLQGTRRGAVRPRVILITGSSPSEGKTTTAINLASSFAAAGDRVILIEADLRRPAIGPALDIKPEAGIVRVMMESMALEDALVPAPVLSMKLDLLLADYEGGWISDLFMLPAAREMLEEAKRIADYVIIDSPPLTDVIDALPLVNYVDDVLITVRLGRTRIKRLTQLGEILAENGTRPTGFAVVGVSRPGKREHHYYLDEGNGQGPGSARRLLKRDETART
jgi:receptor protein-tyrosine kinase